MNDNRFWITIWGMVIGAILLLILGICAMDYAHTRKMAQMGYAQVPDTHTTTVGMRWERK